MRVVVTGASGFLGRALCAALVARGDTVVAPLRRPRVVAGLPADIERIEWDVTAGRPPSAALIGVDAVVHLAGETIAQRWTEDAKRRIRESRVSGTRHLVDGLAALDVRPRALVSASAIGIYGDRGDETLDEESASGSGFLAEICEAWEAEARRAEALDIRVARLRLGVVLDRGGGALARLLPPFKLGLGGRIGSGRQWMSWIHRADVVGLILHSLDDARAATALNATAPEPVQNRDFARILAATLRRPAVVPTPAFALRLAFGEMADLMLASERVVPRRAAAIGYQFRFPALAPALHEIVQR